MHIKKQTYAVMDGEPHLGSITEYELISEPFEVADWLLDKAVKNGKLEEEYEFGEVIIIADEWVDVESVNLYLDREIEVCIDTLYVYAEVVNKVDR